LKCKINAKSANAHQEQDVDINCTLSTLLIWEQKYKEYKKNDFSSHLKIALLASRVRHNVNPSLTVVYWTFFLGRCVPWMVYPLDDMPRTNHPLRGGTSCWDWLGRDCIGRRPRLTYAMGFQRDVVYHARPIAPSYISPNGWAGGRAQHDFSLAWLEAAWYCSESGHGTTQHEPVQKMFWKLCITVPITLGLNSRLLLMYPDTVMPGYPVQNYPSGSFLSWGGPVGREGIVYDIAWMGCPRRTPWIILCTPVCFHILSSSLTSVSISSFWCYSSVSITVVSANEYSCTQEPK
jgi:hypothetical protein